jgi:hypothetical protein
MKTTASSKRDGYLTGVGVFLVIVALITAIAGCVEPAQYDLTISTGEGGEVTSPGEGTFAFEVGEVVSLVAVAENGYRFANWTGNVSTIADVNAASTTIPMDDSYSVTANFVRQYVLTIDGADGGEVTSPGEGTFTYDAGTVVELTAEAREGYKFLNWTGSTETVADADVASTTLTMEGDYGVTGNFTLTNIYFGDIGPGPWALTVAGQGVEATVAEEGIIINIASDPVDAPDGEPFAARGYPTHLLTGDFDVRMDYELTTWPQKSGIRVGIGVGVPDMADESMVVERVSWYVLEWPYLPFREAYLVDFGRSTVGITSTDDLSGTLRIRREGETLTGYYRTSEGWQELYEARWSTEDVRIWVGTWGHDCLFGGEEVGVLMRTVEVVQPAAQ